MVYDERGRYKNGRIGKDLEGDYQMPLLTVTIMCLSLGYVVAFSLKK
jgi:hypothetical protein